MQVISIGFYHLSFLNKSRESGRFLKLFIYLSSSVLKVLLLSLISKEQGEEGVLFPPSVVNGKEGRRNEEEKGNKNVD